MLHLNCHSIYTYKCSIAKIDDIAKKSKDLGEKSFCITDLDSFSSIKKANDSAKKLDMKLIAGYEARLQPKASINSFLLDERKSQIKKLMSLKRTTDSERECLQQEINNMPSISLPYSNMVLIAKNLNGFKNLINIYNSEIMQGDTYMVGNEYFFNLTKNNVQDIICMVGINSMVGFYLKNDLIENAEESALYLKNLFGENFYIQIDATGINSFNTNQGLIDLSKKLNIPFVVANDVRYVEKEDRNDYRLFRNIMSGDVERYENDNSYMMDEETLVSFMLNQGFEADDVKKSINNVRVIDEQIEAFEFPSAPKLINCEDQLRELCEIGWNKIRKGTEWEEESRKRMEYELEVINSKNFSQYFIKIHHIVQTAYDNDILMGPGRGSGCGSEVCYLLSITKIDPLKYGLLFERFLNPQRKNYPDIDLDFATLPLNADLKDLAYGESDDEVNGDSKDLHALNSRNLLMNKLVENGHFKFAHYITNEVNTTTVVLFKNLAKYYEIPFYQANKISTSDKFKEKFAEKEYSGWLKEAVDFFGFYWEDYWDRLEKYMPFCYKYTKTPSGASVAASGVIMGDTIPTLPLQDNAFRLNGVDLEEVGYIKYDLLSVNTLNQIAYFEGKDTDWNDTNDPKVWDMIDSGDTDYCFQFSSPGMKNIITKTKPRNIDDLAEINALYRPGPLNAGYVEKYIALKTKNGDVNDILTKEEIILYNLLKSVFGEHHVGLPIFQEDIMKICQEGAGFTPAEADDIRKAMGKKKMAILEGYKPRFVENWKYDCDAESVWNAIVGFGEYAFNKSHSVAYAMVGYKTAKIWCYHRDEYLEFSLNYDTKARYQLAMDKLKELNYRYSYPSIKNMKGDLFKIANNSIMVPGYADKNYSSYVEFLFGETKDLYNLIYKGTCDDLTKDRYALVSLVDACPQKIKEQALYMEPVGETFDSLEQILNGLKSLNYLDWEKNDEGHLEVKISRKRGKDLEIIFHRNNSDYNRLQNLKYDLKKFGSVRAGILSNEPYINTSAIERTLNNIKEQGFSKGYDDNKVYYMMKDKIESYMREWFSNPIKNTFENVYAMLIDLKQYERSTKIVVEFNDKQDIFYIPKALSNKVLSMDKKSLIKMKMVYSPFISKRKLEFVYDFDIEEIEAIKI